MNPERSSTTTPAYSPDGTTIPRHIAAVLDNILAMVLAVFVAKQLPGDQAAVQTIAFAMSFFAYFFFFELVFSSTPAKFMNGLIVLASTVGVAPPGRRWFVR